jgi:VanZ family protein
LAPAVWAGFILVLTSLPGSAVPTIGITNFDKAVHFSLYAIEAVLTLRALRAAGRRDWATVALLIVALSAMGAADEWHQQFIPGRSQDRYDWMADTLGAAVGALIAAGALARRETMT